MATTTKIKPTSSCSSSSPSSSGGVPPGRRLSSRPSTPDKDIKSTTANYLKPTASFRGTGTGHATATSSRPSLASAGKRVISNKTTTSWINKPPSPSKTTASPAVSTRALLRSSLTSSPHSPNSPKPSAAPAKAAASAQAKSSGTLASRSGTAARTPLTRTRSFDRSTGFVNKTKERTRSATPPPPQSPKASVTVEEENEEMLVESEEHLEHQQHEQLEKIATVTTIDQEAVADRELQVHVDDHHKEEQRQQQHRLFADNETNAFSSEEKPVVCPPTAAPEMNIDQLQQEESKVEEPNQETCNVSQEIEQEASLETTMVEDNKADQEVVNVVLEEEHKVALNSSPVVVGRRREIAPAGNAVIEERLEAEKKRKNKVLALVGAFETVISMQEPDNSATTPQTQRHTSPLPAAVVQSPEKAAEEVESVTDEEGSEQAAKE